MTGQYDDAYLRANADALRAEDWQSIESFLECHRYQASVTEDDAADLAKLAAVHPDLIRRKDAISWPTATSMTTPARQRATISTRVPVSTTRRPSSSGSSSASARGPASASSRGRASKSGARLLVDGGAWLLMFTLLAAWYLAIRQVGGA